MRDVLPCSDVSNQAEHVEEERPRQDLGGGAVCFGVSRLGVSHIFCCGASGQWETAFRSCNQEARKQWEEQPNPVG